MDINKLNFNMSPEHDLNEESNPNSNFDCIQEMIESIDQEMESDLNKHDQYYYKYLNESQGGNSTIQEVDESLE